MTTCDLSPVVSTHIRVTPGDITSAAPYVTPTAGDVTSAPADVTVALVHPSPAHTPS